MIIPGNHLPLYKVITVLFDYIPYAVHYIQWLIYLKLDVLIWRILVND